MKQTFMSKITKRMIALGLSFVLLLGVGFHFSEIPKVDATESYWNVVQTDNIGAYWTEENKTAPDITDLITDGSVADKDWVFAGWYTTVECTKAWSTTATGTTAYAKFVPTSTFVTLCQTLASTTEDSTDPSKLRILMTIDSLKYANVGFKIKLNGKEKPVYWSNTVYESIKVDDANCDVAFTKKPNEIANNAEFFSTMTIINISKTNWHKPIFITPCWETQDGTIVEGLGRYARIEDYYKNIVNIPVQIHEDAKAVAAGFLKVSYDSKFTFEGFDAGTIFEEVNVGNDAVNKNVACVGNVADISNNKSAEGMYINLRFAVSDLTQLGTTETFTVSAEEFCDVDEKTINLDIADAVYTNYNQ